MPSPTEISESSSAPPPIRHRTEILQTPYYKLTSPTRMNFGKGMKLMVVLAANETDKVYRRLVRVKTKNYPQERYKRAGFLGLFGPRADLQDHCEKKLEDMEGDLRTERSSVAGKTSPQYIYLSCGKIISQVITGYLSSLILEAYLSAIPPTMIVLSSIQGYISLSQIEKSVCIKVLWFTIWNIFFANVLSGSALYRINVFLEPKRIPEKASFFIAYVVTSGWTKTFCSKLFLLKRFFWSFLKSDEEVSIQRNLQLYIEEHGRYLQMMFEKQCKSGVNLVKDSSSTTEI
ncbi:CSC1-like protein hyp1 [Phtheirospermum japonicum]|uniref:CSC1-like protein hyp1 n=1 Tax=Phtheirospermum japonicum TaxID=374723 RepID=A0A830CE61_9LAMI|nr:CSC1-like protein hyp1 [Phtheirospermum japonicum]